jgi:predicted heme/steroid binding protein/uncharacterized membrane protein
MAEDLPVFTPESLKEYDGKEGRKAYIAYKDGVYDVTESKMWKNGSHMKRHSAGQDLTAEITEAPHDEEVFERFPKVGTFQGPAAEEEESHLPAFLDRFFARFPFFERHPHPLLVHFPVAFLTAAPIFAVLFLIFDVRAFELTSFYLVAAGGLMTLLAIPSGFLTWWVNFMSRPMRAVIIKIVLSIVMLVVSVIAFVWRLINPEVMLNLSGVNIVYFGLLVLLALLVGLVGYYGGIISMPLPPKQEKNKES